LEWGLQLAAEVHTAQHNGTTSLAAMVRAHMTAIGLESEASSAWGDGVGSGNTEPCMNVHGVLRGPQTDGTEALLVVTPAALTLVHHQGCHVES
jgi:hypothetical protein